MKSINKKRAALRRYTDLAALISLLTERKLTFLDPESWDDSNDSHYLTQYREKKSLQSVLAVCFTQTEETYHHWRVFSNGSAGVCIVFDQEKILDAVRRVTGVRCGPVKYRTMNQIRRKHPMVSDLPFLKRYPFEAEREYRMIFESSDKAESHLDVPVPLSSIIRINLSPWLHASLVTNIKNVLKAIDGCERLQIVRSTLIGNDEWKGFGDSAEEE